MPNLRIIHNNSADIATGLTASTTAGGLVASNMLNDFKGSVHRSTGTSVTYTLTWLVGQGIGGVSLPATNLTADATWRVRGYSAGAGGTLVMDSGVVYACPGGRLGMWDWSRPVNANAFAYGGSAKTALWFAAQPSVKRLEILVEDPTNAAGFIDCARIIAGTFWEPKVNPGYGVSIGVDDSSTNTRNDSGDFITDRAAVGGGQRRRRGARGESQPVL